jgi:arabinan endo-1,5-alpha-L-arabinosidase
VVVSPAERLYYLYGTTDRNCWEGPGTGFDVYFGPDLENWDGPFPVFRPPPLFWGETNFWAPEVHWYGGRPVMLASFKGHGRRRGTQVLVAADLHGPFVPLGDSPITPPDWECLDGTLHIDEAGAPWLVFCREWVEVGDGEIWAMPLSSDLREAAGEPALLFRASSAPWVVSNERGGYVTDGPFVFRGEDGGLKLLWSSRGDQGYALGLTTSGSGDIRGPWRHEPLPLFRNDGGHGMVFTSLQGHRMLAFHCPDTTPFERAVFVPL